MSARMITGFNSDIEHGGKVFHVQTEEKGLDNPIVITLVYCGGEIVTSLEASYADLVDDDPAPEDEVRRRMSVQHQRLIQQILRGRFSPAQMPYGHDLISDRSLDELVLNYLEDEITERTAKVGRVLTKLERFLSAAEQAKAEPEPEPEPPAEPATVEDDPVDQSTETVDAVEIEFTPDVATQIAAPTAERRRRKTGWIWAALAATLVAGVAGLYVIRSLGQEASAGSVVVPTPAPAIESNREAVEPGTDVLAGVAVSTEAPAPAVEEVPDEPTEAEPVTPRIPPVVDSPVAEPRPTVVAEQSDPVVEQPRLEPEPSAAIPVEAEAQVVIDEPTVEDEPIAADEPIHTQQDVDVSPMASQRDLPRYTRRARRLQQEGIVKLRILIDSHGEVADAELLSGIPDSDLDQAALEVTRDWTFSPARKSGQRVAVWKEVAFEFSVRPDRTTSVRIRE